MADQLAGITVALAGPRKSEELAKLISNMGGTALLRPAQGTVFLDDEELRQELELWTANPPDWTILTTGMGLDALFMTAGSMGIEERLQDALAGSMIAARGYKTVNALKKRGLVPDVRDDDGSTTGLIRGLAPFDLRGKKVILQLHGDPAPRLNAWLEEVGAEVRQVLPYRHTPPKQEELERLLTEITEEKVDAVAFTSAPQMRFLAEYALGCGRLQAMLHAFENGVLAVAVGRITADALKEAGVKRIIMPEQERMGSMIVELGRYLAARS
ncbi:uroporphyrinogen-III synthase [Paenibacillus forsythiae]|uniref:Uroporphyrinogen-III synthase n=1 Tax=Paenibacillus forsythiae TaxID=365616 RepID=A0ABU3H4X2_9BACL|nr:uroporphyrinogen-III synthase [Paenibacillus forsythiae]MDT3425506.1 uroporphyrinogen-III synthase [Paenibacillus forsythiae]